jgi:outer membrane protein assembly factor BamB
VLKECTYYKRVRHTRIALVLTMALSLFARSFASSPAAERPAASSDDPVPAVWPVAAAWPKSFPAIDALSLLTSDSHLLAVESTQVSALSWSDGEVLWKSSLSASTRPVVDEGRVFVPAGDAIHALSDASGKEEWRLTVGSISIPPAARSGWLIVAAEDGSLQGINAAQGREVWRIALPAPLTSPVAIDADLVIGACADGVIRAWQIADGSVRWTRELGTRPTQLTAGSGHLFVGGEDGRLMSLRQRDGRLNWAYPFAMSIVGRLAFDQKNVYATTIDNTVRAHAFNGHQVWHKPLTFRVIDGMLSDAGGVFVPQSNGEIRIFLAKDGTRAGRLNTAPEDATVIGALAAHGAGDQLRMAITTSAGSQLTVTTYRRTGLAAVPATSGPPATPLLLSLPGGRP